MPSGIDSLQALTRTKKQSAMRRGIAVIDEAEWRWIIEAGERVGGAARVLPRPWMTSVKGSQTVALVSATVPRSHARGAILNLVEGALDCSK